MIQKQALSIRCDDNFELSGMLYTSDEVKAAVMIAPATGIKKEFYASFATHLAKNGFATLTFDNRGIGGSKGDSLNGVNASLINWGKLDLSAALNTLKEQLPNTNYHLVGHSAGGQLVGLMDNAHDLSSMFNFGSSSGSLHYAKYPFKLMSAFFLNFYIPTSNLLFGHTKSQWVGMGEPLPKLVGKQWSQWCNGKGYVKVALDREDLNHHYDSLELNSIWVHASDDDIANLDTVKDMIRVYSKIESKIHTLNPQELGFKDIGHMKFFSKRRKVLWDLATDWFNQH
ncbi:alpha/beta hydrolase family protein [Gilvibacter sp.]|uniref:alpha/beta hydrolase family protein n=1 Tax=Gilvibacter sp. TaxID=2729997 RepID=UPI003F49E32E